MLANALPDPMLRGFILQNLIIEDRIARWRLNVNALQAGMSDLTGWPDDLEGVTYTGPALSIYGGTSDYVDTEGRAALSRQFPAITFTEVPAAGHWLHAEKPTEFLGAVQGWLSNLR